MTNINKKYLAKEIPLTENIFGHKIEDNYRYFEDIKNPDFLDWVQKQSKITRDFLDEDQTSKKIYEELLEIDKQQKITYSQVFNKKEHIYYLKRHFSEKRGKLYRTNYTTKKEECLFDFDSLDKQYGGDVTLHIYNVSPNEKYISMAIGVDGNESGVTIFFNLETFQLENDIIKKSRYTTAIWVSDECFLYIDYPNLGAMDGTSAKNMNILYHKLGTDFSKDILICSETSNPEIDDLGETNYFGPYYDEKNKKLFIYHYRETEFIDSLYVSNFDKENLKDKFVFEKLYGFDEKIKYGVIFEEKLYYMTNQFSDNFELRTSSLKNFNNSTSQEISTPKGEILQATYQDKHSLYVMTLKETHNKLYKLDFETNILIPIKTESIGAIQLSWEMGTVDEEEMLFRLTNFKTPYKYFQIDENYNAVAHPFVSFESNLNLKDIVIKSEEYISHDGVKVPITFAYKKGLTLNGKNRCLINAYGAYAWVNLAEFSAKNYRWIDNGGILAIAHVRGGGEKGNVWHLAGKKKNKFNSWNDLIFAGKYFIENGYTSKEYLACEGVSAGGITVGMVANESEEIFGAILSNVGCNNATRSGINPGGSLSEQGNPKIEEEFTDLLKFDVFHNIKEGKAYTNMLLNGGVKDDRVDYWRPAKAAAKMQKCTSSSDRIAFIAYDDLGHDIFGSSNEVYLKYVADQFAFLDKVLKK